MLVHTKSHRVGDTHKALAHPLCIRKRFNVAALARPLKRNPCDQINFLVFIAQSLLAYIKELIISGHLLLLYSVLHYAYVGPPMCFCMLCHSLVCLLFPPSVCVGMARLCLFPHVCARVCVCVCVTYVRCITVR